MAPRREPDSGKPATFAEIVAAERNRPTADEADGRFVNRVMDRELWDDVGRHWIKGSPLTPHEVAALVDDMRVPVVEVWTGGRQLTFVSAVDRPAWWQRVQAGLGQYGERLHPNEEGLAFVAELWTRAGDERMMVVQVFC